MTLTSKYAHFAQYQSPWWQATLKDPIHLALENHTISWGEFALDDPLPMTDILDTFLDPTRCVRLMKEPRVRFAEEPHVRVAEEPHVRVAEEPQVRVAEEPAVVVTVPPPQKGPLATVRTVIVYNLPRSTLPEQLGREFSHYGPIEDVYLPRNHDPTKGPVGSIRGFAMIRFAHTLASTMAVTAEKSRGRQIEFAKSDRK